MTLEELRLRIAGVTAPDEEFNETADADGSVHFELGKPLGCIKVFWTQDRWEVWAGPRGLEVRMRATLLNVTAHQLIAARRRLSEAADAH